VEENKLKKEKRSNILIIIGSIIAAPFVFVLSILLVSVLVPSFQLMIHNTSMYETRYRIKNQRELVQRFGGVRSDWKMIEYQCYATYLGEIWCGSEWEHTPTEVTASSDTVSLEESFLEAFQLQLIRENYGFIENINQVVNDIIPNERVRIGFEPNDHELSVPTCNRKSRDCNLVYSANQLKKPTLELNYTLHLNIFVTDFNPAEAADKFVTIGELVKRLILKKADVGEYAEIYIDIIEDLDLEEDTVRLPNNVAGRWSSRQLAWEFATTEQLRGHKSINEDFTDFPPIPIEGY